MERFDLEKIGMIVYPSKLKTPDSRFKHPSVFTGIVIKGEKATLTAKFIQNRIKEFIVFANFLRPCDFSVKWFNEFDFFGIEEKILPLSELEDFLTYSIELDQTKLNFTERGQCNYVGEWRLFGHLNKSNNKINFEESFLHFIKLDKLNKVKQQISLFALNGSISTLLSPFYNNSNIEVSFMFSIIDSLLDSSNDKTDKMCPNCGVKVQSGRKKMQKRIKEFISSLGFEPNSREVIIKIVLEFYKVRNSFFHDVLIQNKSEIIENIVQTTGDSFVPIDKEIELGNARFLGYMIVTEIVQLLLLEKLSEAQMLNE